MGLYRLLKKHGNHVEYDGKKPITYKGGDAVPSEYDLAKLFPDKFVSIRPEENEDVKVKQPDIPVPISTKTTKAKTAKAKTAKAKTAKAKTDKAKTDKAKTTSTQRKRAVPKAKSEGV